MKREGNQSQTRFIISLALFISAFISAVVISYAANRGAHYWILTHNIPKGVQITARDLMDRKASLGENPAQYLSTHENPIGSITKRSLDQGEFIPISALSEDLVQLSSEQLSISVRTVDIPSTISVGEIIDIYQLHDSKNGEASFAPQLIVGGAFVQSIDRKGNGFGGDVALTISVDGRSIEPILISTTSGRLVVVKAQG